MLSRGVMLTKLRNLGSIFINFSRFRVISRFSTQSRKFVMSSIVEKDQFTDQSTQCFTKEPIPAEETFVLYKENDFPQLFDQQEIKKLVAVPFPVQHPYHALQTAPATGPLITLHPTAPGAPPATATALPTAIQTFVPAAFSLQHPQPLTIRQSLEADVSVSPISGSSSTGGSSEKRKLSEDNELNKELKKAKLETKALKAKRPGFTDERYNETSYYIENGLRKVYPYYFMFTTFTKGRWVGEKILDVFAREFRAHPVEIYEKCIKCGSLTVNYEKVDVDYRLKHNDLLANMVHRHEVPIAADPINIIHMDEDIVVVNKPASIPVHPCGRYRHNTVVFILAKEYNLKNLRTIHRLDRLTSGLLLFGRTTKKARLMELHIRNRQVQKEYVCRVEGKFPSEKIVSEEPIEVVSYKIGVCKVSKNGKSCSTTFQLLFFDESSNTSVVLASPHTGRMHQIRVHLQYLGYPVINDPLYNHTVFGPEKGKGGNFGKSDEELITDLINIHNAEKWLGIDGDIDLSMFKSILKNDDIDYDGGSPCHKECSRETSPCDLDEDSVSTTPPPAVESLSLPTSTTPSATNIQRADSSDRNCKVTVATQTGQETPDLAFNPEKVTYDENCYECKVKYRDPKPKDLVMYLHAWKYRGPGWAYETELPEWAKQKWKEPIE